MLVKVTVDELIAEHKLGFNVYYASGELAYPIGYAFSRDDLQATHGKSFYRSVLSLPVNVDEMDDDGDDDEYEVFSHEGTIYRVPKGLTVAERHELKLESMEKPIYDEEMASAFVHSIQHFWERMARGASPDIALCEVVSEKMIAEVTNKTDEIFYLSQIRVRDKFTYSHILDVTALSIALAIKAGFSKKEVKEIALAAILHDTGKLLIPKSIMFKPGRLTEKEFQVMKLHPELGYKILVNELRIPEQIAKPALEHQEMYGGGGYPQNLKGDEIHPYSHIVKIADVYDALTSKRPYKESIPSSKAIKIMLSEGEKSFHPEMLGHFVQLANYHDHAYDVATERVS